MGTPYGYGYHIVNLLNGKIYAGQSIQPVVRWKEHISAARRGVNYHLYKAMNRYGTDAFEFRIVFEASSQEELDAWEIAEIANLNLMDPAVGYNKKEGGGSGKLSPEALKRVSRGQKKVWSNPAYRKRRSDQMKEYSKSPVFKATQAAARAKYINEPTYRRNLSAGAKASWADPEQKRKRVAAMVANRPEDYAEIIREGQKKRWDMPGARAAQSVRSRKLAEDPNWRKKVSHGLSIVCNTPEARARLSETNRRRWRNPENRMKQSIAVSMTRRSRAQRIFIEGSVYDSLAGASEATNIYGGTISYRINSTETRWKWWFKLPHHRDPECDAVEECWAIMQWENRPIVIEGQRSDAEVENEEAKAARRSRWLAEANVRRWADPKNKEAMSTKMKGLWEENKAELLTKTQSPEVRAKRAATLAVLRDDPVYRRNHAEGTRAAQARPEVKAKRSASMKKHFTLPENRNRARELTIERFSREGEREKHGIAIKAAWENDLTRELMLLKRGIQRAFVEGQFYESAPAAARALLITSDAVKIRADSKNFPAYRLIPRHGDPECDAVEECWAQMQFAAACPDHPNVPDWLRDPELVALEQGIKDMLAERRRRQAASSEQAAA